jgi:hypothetical protein
MASKAMTPTSDSWNPSELPMWDDDVRPALTLTPAAKANLAQDDAEYAFFCPGCVRPISKCSCPIDER